MFFAHMSSTLSFAPKGVYCYRALRRICLSVMIDLAHLCFGSSWIQSLGERTVVL